VRTWVALLRGVNLGQVNKVSMPALREALTEAGFGTVRTYVNSGNVVLESSLGSAAKVADAVHDVVADRFDLDVPVMVRTGRQLAAILDWNPFPEAVLARPNLVSVVHLAAKPSAARIREMLATDVTPDEIAARGLEVVIAYAERTGGPRTDKALRVLGVDGTARNWRTLSALVDLAATEGRPAGSASAARTG
jgi:uncharacterized protein (DUF1697 family)